MKNGENMQFKDNIDCEKSYHEKIIRICDRHPKDEEMLLVKAKSLKLVIRKTRSNQTQCGIFAFDAR